MSIRNMEDQSFIISQLGYGMSQLCKKQNKSKQHKEIFGHDERVVSPMNEAAAMKYSYKVHTVNNFEYQAEVLMSIHK